MTFTYLSLILFLIAATMITSHAVSAYRVGLSKSIIRLAVTVGSAFLAALISSIATMLGRSSIEEKIASWGIFNGLQEGFGDLVIKIQSMAALLYSIVLFIPIFILLLIIARIVLQAKFKINITKNKETNKDYLHENASYLEKNNKHVAILVGVICGFLTSVIMFSPLTGILRNGLMLTDLAKGLENNQEDYASEDYASKEAMESIEMLETYANDFAVVLFDTCGGRVLFDTTTTFIRYGTITNISREIRIICSIELDRIQKIGWETDVFDQKIADACYGLLEKTKQSPTLKMLLTTSANKMASLWLANDYSAEFMRPEATNDPIIKPLADQMLEILSTSDEYTICEDLTTLLDLLMIFNECADILNTDDYQLIADSFAVEKLESRIKAILAANPRTKFMAPGVNTLLMQLVVDEIYNSLKYSEETREDLFDSIAQTFQDTKNKTTSIRTKLLLNEINNALEEYGVYTNQAFSQKITEMLLAEFGNKKDVSLEDLEAYFSSLKKE